MIAHVKQYFSFMVVILFFSFLSGCITHPSSSEIPLEKTSFQQLIGWEGEDHIALLSLMWRQCHRLSQLPLEADLGGSIGIPSGRNAESWNDACASLPQSEQITKEEARAYFEQWFQPYLFKKTAFYTGYYEPEIPASLEHIGGYNFPIYHKPDDLVRTRDQNGKIVFGRDVNGFVAPYDDRATIDSGSLKGKHLEVAWLKDPVALFFLQIQGSGRLRLPNGQIIRVTYDGQNGQNYVPIGKIFIQQGLLKPNDVNEYSIRQWLNTHPQEIKTILEKNPNYVFFRLVEHSATEGPVGSFGLPLITGRSLAVNRHEIPFGSLIWVQTAMAEGVQEGRYVKKGRWHHLAFAQDSANDINGGVRADIFTGWGDRARFLAENLHDKGQMFLLLPKNQAEGGDAPKMVESQHVINSEDAATIGAAKKTQ